MIVAVDGPSASGKGSLSRRLAQHYGLHYLDTGILYRAVAREMLDQHICVEDTERAERIARNLDVDSIDKRRLRERGVGEAASRVAAFPGVREALLDVQRAFAGRPGGALLDGRDIGTVVCPDADAKLYITASTETRARRRFLELRESGTAVEEWQVYDDIVERDTRDRERISAPLRKAEDAYLLDTTNLGIDQAFKAAVDLIEAALRRSRSDR